MKRAVSFLIPSALVLTTCASLLVWWFHRHDWPGTVLAQLKQARAAPTPTEQKITFMPKGALDYLDERGFRGSSQMFESSDKVGVELTKERRDASKDADGALEEELLRAIRVVERKPLLDGEGRRFGDRALAYFPDSEGGQERPAVLRTDGATFYRLESRSLRHLLLLEKELFEGKARPKEQPTPTGLRPGDGR